MIRIFKSARTIDRESGSAMVMVIAIGAVLLVMVAGAMTFAMSGMRKSSTDANWNAALAAATAGVDEYRSRLAADGTYYQYGNPLSAFSTGTLSSVYLPDASKTNPAFGDGAGGSWATLAGSTGASFRYEVDNSDFGNSGVLRVRSTGRVGDSVRTVVANIKAKGFLEYMYFTDYEIQDPELLDAASSAQCTGTLKHEWQLGAPRAGCTTIAFGGGDRVDGKVHSNDTIRICSATFESEVTTQNPNPPFYKANDGSNGCGGQNFNGGVPKNAGEVPMPPSNIALLSETRIDDARAVPRPGCLYTGPTTITLNPDGTMTVFSPWTRFTHSGSTTLAAGVVAVDCGTAGAAGLGKVGGQTFAIPTNNAIYVQNVKAEVDDPNYWASGSFPVVGGTKLNCGSGANSGNGIGYPVTVNSKLELPSSPYGCRDGDIFLKGTLKGRLTIAADSKIFIVDDVKYLSGASPASTDMLGLISNKQIFVWNPADKNNSLLYTSANRTIHAAILSVKNTFQVQNYRIYPNRGTLTVFGSISQKFRGIVSQGGGYVKNYLYDIRMRTTAPPKFLNPVSTTYGISTIADVAAAFRPDGARP